MPKFHPFTKTNQHPFCCILFIVSMHQKSANSRQYISNSSHKLGFVNMKQWTALLIAAHSNSQAY